MTAKKLNIVGRIAFVITIFLALWLIKDGANIVLVIFLTLIALGTGVLAAFAAEAEDEEGI
jgi:hypothetical protein